MYSWMEIMKPRVLKLMNVKSKKAAKHLVSEYKKVSALSANALKEINLRGQFDLGAVMKPLRYVN